MFLADSHTHTRFSPDGSDPMSRLAAAAVKKGAAYLCFTDHVDDCSINDPVSFDVASFDKWDELKSECAGVRAAFEGKLDVCLGAEVSSINHMPDTARAIYEDADLDLVIGSLHSLRDTDDFYVIKYTSLGQCTDLTERYLKEHIELANTGLCDVFGHLGYTKRYMARSGFRLETTLFEPCLREIFSVIIPKGIGIELNTSGLRDMLGESIPDAAVLRLYRECGGEVITVGSDAHAARDVCAGIADAYSLLRDIGFRYVTVFRKHRPEFIKI